MKDLDLLFKEKREEPTTVPISAVDSWLKGGLLAFGLFAAIQKLFIQKPGLMFTSISTFTLIAILTLFPVTSSKGAAQKKTKQVQITSKIIEDKRQQAVISEATNAQTYLNPPKEAMSKLTPLIASLQTPNSNLKLLEPPIINPVSSNLDTSIYFDRIDISGSLSFMLVNGATCSVTNLLQDGTEAAALNYKIKNGTLYLDESTEMEASVLVVTVPDLTKLKANGFCQVVTPQPFNASNLEVEVNGFVKLDLQLKVKELELDLNGENTGKISVNSDNFELKINGVNDLEVLFMVKQSWIDINGLGKLKFSGSARSTMMEINGENKFDGEAFSSEELYLKVSGIQQKIETTVFEKLDVEISGSNNVIIQGDPKTVIQEVAPTSKLKLK